MPESFNVQFLDLMVYILPGSLLLFTIVHASRPDLLEHLSSRHHIIHFVALAFVFAFVLGFLVHIASSTTQGVLFRLAGIRSVEAFLDKSPETAIAEEQAPKRIKISFVDRMALYRYAQTVVEEQMPVRAASASRLEALGLFSRNLIPVALFAFVTLGWRRLVSRPLIRLSAAVGVLLLVALLWHGYLVYSRNSVYITLRAFSTWCAQQ